MGPWAEKRSYRGQLAGQRGDHMEENEVVRPLPQVSGEGGRLTL